MKKLLISLVMLIPLLAGCANIDTRININDDKSASVVSSVTYQGNLADGSDPVAAVITASYPKLLDKYYVVDKTTSKNLSTITATKKVTNIESNDIDLGSLGFTTNLASGKYIEVKKNFLVKSYNVDLKFDYNAVKDKLNIPKIDLNAKQPDKKLEHEYFDKYINPADVNGKADIDKEFDMAANLDDSAKQLTTKNDASADKKANAKASEAAKTATFSIQLPAFASYNNADSVNGNEYSWVIKEDGTTNIKLQYVKYSGWALTFIILLGILLLVYVARRIIRRDTTKRIDNIENIV